MADEKRARLIIGIQMFSMGVILAVFGLAVIAFSPFRTMEPGIRMWATISDIAITGVGLAFIIFGRIRIIRAKKET